MLIQHVWFSLKSKWRASLFQYRRQSYNQKVQLLVFELVTKKKNKKITITEPVEILWSTSSSIAKYIWPGDSAIFSTEEKAVKMLCYFPKFIFTYSFFYLDFKREKNQSIGRQLTYRLITALFTITLGKELWINSENKIYLSSHRWYSKDLHPIPCM